MTHILKRICLRTALFAVFTSLAAAPLTAFPSKGTSAPPLESLKLLQAPPSATADRASLKGKVIVLEFWATWCSPCIATLPHFNQLVAALDPAKFQFISIDDEDLKVVQNFLTKKKMSGWVGLDPSGTVFASYGVKARPTTIIIDATGKIVTVTELQSVTAADLRAVAAGKPISFKPAVEITESNISRTPDTAQPLFSVSVSKALAGSRPLIVKHPPTGTDYLGQDADSLLTNVFNLFSKRYVLKAPLPDRLYDLRVNFADVPQSVADSAAQQSVLAALHLQLQPKTITSPAYILRAITPGKTRLSSSASAHAAKRGYWHSGFVLMNGTMDDLAYILATGLETPVINQTGIDGAYDARFKVAGTDLESLNTVLKESFGLELVPVNQELSITVLEVTKQESTKPPPTATTPAANH